MPGDVLAKSNGTTFQSHTEDLLQGIEVFYTRYKDSFPEDWWKALKYAALLHDLGKIDPEFQNMLKNNSSRAPGLNNSVPHSLLSIMLFQPYCLKLQDLELKHTVVSAVAFHHWRSYFSDILIGHRTNEIREKAKNILKDKDTWVEYCKQLKESLKALAEKYLLESDIIQLNEELLEYLACGNILGYSGLLNPPYSLVFLPEKIRKSMYSEENDRMRIFISGNLLRADHFASLVEDNPCIKITDIESGSIPGIEDLDRVLSGKFGCEYWQKEFFTEKQPGLRNSNMVLVAPTGFGKTEFSYIWAAGLKTIMILPMRAAVNKIWERTRELFGELGGEFKKEDVALLHGDASLEIYLRQEDNNEQETEGERRKALELARHLSKSYIVGTADQIAPAALRYPGYERILAALMIGGLVIDEIQAYDPRAAAIVTHLVQQNSAFGGKTLLMTATLPPFIKQELQKRLDLKPEQIVYLIEQDDFRPIAKSCRHKVSFLFSGEQYSKTVTSVIERALKGQKVLVVMNTVKAACLIYEEIRKRLKSDSLLTIRTSLFHSRFTTGKRQELEREIVEELMPNKPERNNKACIVVTTQIVEASIDMDADVLFTEPAPADSLIQRMGRVYRRYSRVEGDNSPEEPNVYILISNKPQTDNKSLDNEDVPLASGLGRIYDRNLVALSLAALIVGLSKGIKLHKLQMAQLYSCLQESPWKDCFPSGKKSRTKKAQLNKSLLNIIEKTAKPFTLSEEDKQKWVDITYETLMGAKSELNIDLGNYLEIYKNTLDILDSGYCSDKKREAMDLFRKINSITGIPQNMVIQFYQKVSQWVADKDGNIYYEDFAVKILPQFTVDCPWEQLRDKTDLLAEPVVDSMIPPQLDKNKYPVVYGKLTRWLAGLKILPYDYDQEKGLKLNYES